MLDTDIRDVMLRVAARRLREIASDLDKQQQKAAIAAELRGIAEAMLVLEE